MTGAAQTEELAARWIARMDESEWSDADQAELDAWLNEAMIHRVAFLRLQSVWRRADRLTVLRAPKAVIGSAVGFRPSYRMAAAIVAAVGIGAGVLAYAPQISGKRYATEIGQQTTVPLRDGTRVELNTDTRLRAVVDGEQRVVWLDKGEAYFEVAHDPSRPFVIHAGRKTITVLGTKFSVRRQGDDVKVAVVEGRVRVEPERITPSAQPAVATRGDLVVAQGAAVLLAARSVEKVESDLAWRNGALVFDRSSLADAVAEFNRYNRKKLVIGDEETRDLRIGGSFEADNVEAFARLLREAFGLHVEEKGDEIKISG